MNTATHHITSQQFAVDADLTIHTMPSLASMVSLFEDLGSEADAYELENDPFLAEDLQAYHELLQNEIVDL